MGKGTIISHIEGGQYQVSVQYNVERVQAEKAANLAKIANLEAQIAEETDDQKLNVLKLQKLSLEKRNEILDAIPESKEITAWCADLTEDLTGDIGLIEVPGESVAFNIQPGYEGNAAYNAARDGQLTPTMAMDPAAAFYNLAMLPGWQKWKPTYRYGTITAISGDTADVTLDAATSTQQSLGVNQESTLAGVPIEYMSCNGAAFEVGDEVLVKFTGQDWAAPEVVGFKDTPGACGLNILSVRVDSSFVLWDLNLNAPMDVSGISELSGISWPVDYTDETVTSWITSKKITAGSSFMAFEYDTSLVNYDYVEGGHLNYDSPFFYLRFRSTEKNLHRKFRQSFLEYHEAFDTYDALTTETVSNNILTPEIVLSGQTLFTFDTSPPFQNEYDRSGYFLPGSENDFKSASSQCYGQKTDTGAGIFCVVFHSETRPGLYNDPESVFHENNYFIYSGGWSGNVLNGDGLPNGLAPFEFSRNSVLESYIKTYMDPGTAIETILLEISAYGI